MRSLTVFIISISLFAATGLYGQETDATGQEKAYPDGHGGEVVLPLGSVSFVDSVHSFQVGDPEPRREGVDDPRRALGEPDYEPDSEKGYLTLGCGGTVVFEFTDNVLVDVEGPDLHVFEIGPAVEPTALAISSDGEHWIEIGKIEGGRADIDIADAVDSGARFRYVRLTDQEVECGPPTPGADIDAVAAVGSGYRVSLAGSVLFEVDEAVLKPQARGALDELVERLESLDFPVRLTIEGHTDATGGRAYNRRLSHQRAEAVWDYISQRTDLSSEEVEVEGLGETDPVASNDTPEGRAQNRRVEVFIIPERR